LLGLDCNYLFVFDMSYYKQARLEIWDSMRENFMTRQRMGCLICIYIYWVNEW
jgi:hypothetical protein